MPRRQRHDKPRKRDLDPHCTVKIGTCTHYTLHTTNRLASASKRAASQRSRAAAGGPLRKGRYGRAAVGGPLLHGRCFMAAAGGDGWADNSEEEVVPLRRKQKLVFLNTNKTGNKAKEGAATATGGPLLHGRFGRGASG